MTAHPVLADRAHPQLGLERHPELADDDHIQRRAKRLGDLQGDRDTAAWQAKDNDLLAAQVLQPRGQPPPRVGTISENHDSPLVTSFPRTQQCYQGPWSCRPWAGPDRPHPVGTAALAWAGARHSWPGPSPLVNGILLGNAARRE